MQKISGAVIADLKTQEEYCPPPSVPGDVVPEKTLNLNFDFPDPDKLLDSAINSLARCLRAKGFELAASGWPIRIFRKENYSTEEFELEINASGITLQASDTEGIRRGIYLLEEKLRSASGRSISSGVWKRRPYVHHRISRCFFGPTNRPPFFIDELTNDTDYYPENYLDKLAHEGINGLWLTMYFRDFPSSFFPGRGKDAEKRFQKLRKTVRKCAAYGIKIYVFFCEPKMFGSIALSYTLAESDMQPEMTGFTLTNAGEKLSTKNEFRHFCTSSPKSLEYLEEATETLFRNVSGLGGLINIMYGEDQGGCIDDYIDTGKAVPCPRCSSKNPGKIYRDCAQVMCRAMHKYAPDAELIGWFYAPRQRDGSPQSRRLAELADNWCDDAVMMFNMDSGAAVDQLGKARNVFDYSLACCTPSKLFLECAEKVRKAGAKIQVGCSHEDASVPFVPVPLNLYYKYKTLHDLGVNTVMQCWYFGNYPGVMNRAAGRLSMDPFPEDGESFLLELAEPDWGTAAETVVKAWKYFSAGYCNFPANIGFEWYGPLHNSIVWDWHLFPVDEPIAPSWLLNSFPEKSGDRIGECLNYQHTLSEAMELCDSMSGSWDKGVKLLLPLADTFRNNPYRLRDIGLAEAVGLQMKSTGNLLHFYHLREEMFYDGKNHLQEMQELVTLEISNTARMKELCLADPRLGYHSEAEGYLFDPEKLECRIKSLRKLLSEEFPAFTPDAPWIGKWTGAAPEGKVVCAAAPGIPVKFESLDESGIKFAWKYDNENLTLLLSGVSGHNLTVEIEPCRLWPPVRADFYADGTFRFYGWIFREEPQIEPEQEDKFVKLCFPWKIFDGYRREGSPMRFNIRTERDSYAPGAPWPERLLQRDWNPASAVWLISQ